MADWGNTAVAGPILFTLTQEDIKHDGFIGSIFLQCKIYYQRAIRPLW